MKLGAFGGGSGGVLDTQREKSFAKLDILRTGEEAYHRICGDLAEILDGEELLARGGKAGRKASVARRERRGGDLADASDTEREDQSLAATRLEADFLPMRSSPSSCSSVKV